MNWIGIIQKNTIPHDGLFSQEWWRGEEEIHPIWFTYIESSHGIDNKVVAKNIWFDRNHHVFISPRYVISKSSNHVCRESPLIENYYFKPIAIWVEEDSNKSYLMYSIFSDSLWSSPKKVIKELSNASFPVFITKDAANYDEYDDFFNRLLWISDHSIHEVQLDSNFHWNNHKDFYHSGDSINALSARIDRNSNLWILFDEKPSKDSVFVRTLILPKDSLHWKGPFTLLKLHEKTSQANLNLIDDFSLLPALVLSWIEKDCMHDTLVFYKNDSLHFDSEDYYFIDNPNHTNIEYVSNSLLIGGCVIGFTPYFFMSNLTQSFTELYIRSTSYYDFEPFYSTENKIEHLAISGFNDGHYAVCWSEYDGQQSDIYLYVNYIEIGVGVDNKQNHVQPSSFELYQNNPNPFNSSTTIRYYISKSVDIEIFLFNTLGQKIKVLYTGKQSVGIHSVKLHGNELPSGIYFYILRSKYCLLSRKCFILR